MPRTNRIDATFGVGRVCASDFLTVDVAKAPDAHDQHHQLLRLNLIDDAVIADPQAAQAVELPLERAAGAGSVRKTVDGIDQAQALIPGNGLQPRRRCA